MGYAEEKSVVSVDVEDEGMFKWVEFDDDKSSGGDYEDIYEYFREVLVDLEVLMDEFWRSDVEEIIIQ
jgi:hypothetical protein